MIGTRADVYTHTRARAAIDILWGRFARVSTKGARYMDTQGDEMMVEGNYKIFTPEFGYG